MKPYYQSDRVTLYHGDCLSVLPTLDAGSVDSVVTDPPYGLSFMGKHWDYDVPGVGAWASCLRALKPGGHLLAFAGTRTQHRMAVNIEDAGFDVRDMIAWVYGSGFPKSLDVSKAIDKAAGAERDVVGISHHSANRTQSMGSTPFVGVDGEGQRFVTAPATDAARQWSGWGTALKPAMEPITVARKPLDGTVAENVLTHGTGAINVDGCRVGLGNERPPTGSGSNAGWCISGEGNDGNTTPPSGRWPANLIHDGSEEVMGGFPQVHGAGRARSAEEGTHRGFHDGVTNFRGAPAMRFGDSGSAARFFYCAKASKADRGNDNRHPTVKPIALMRYLCKLVTQPNGVILDPFTGSGSTGKAAVLEGFRFIGIELSDEYAEIARARISATIKEQA